MKRIVLTLMAILLVAYPMFSQTVSVPDTDFLGALIEVGVDTNGDNLISYAEAEAITSLDVTGKGISDMTGIEAFINLERLLCVKNQLTSLDVSNITALTVLFCGANQLTSLDVSNNTALGYLGCGFNQLTSLDVSNNTALGYLGCSENQLTSLDVTNNTALWELHCHRNQLTSLDIFNNSALEWLECEYNQLTILDVSNNTALNYISCDSNQMTGLDISQNNKLEVMKFSGMPSLYEVCVWESFYTDSVIIDIDTTGSPNVYFTTECVYNNDSIVFIPDTAFLYALIEKGVDTNGDSLISNAEAEAVNSIYFSAKGISELSGIESFINLETLICCRNQLTSLDVSNNTELTSLICNDNQLTSLNLQDLISLRVLNCGENSLTEINVSKNDDIRALGCRGNYLTYLNLSNLSTLLYEGSYSYRIVGCGHGMSSRLDLANMPELTKVCFSDSVGENSEWYINNIDTTGSPNVNFTTDCVYNNDSIVFIPDTAFLYALINHGVDTNEDSLISYAEAETVAELNLGYLGISYLTGIEAFTNLEILYCEGNQLTSLDVSNNTALTLLYCEGNQLTSLDVSNNTALKWLFCQSNQLTSLDISNNIAIGTGGALNLAGCRDLCLALTIGDMPSLYGVCVWETFSIDSVGIVSTGSPNVYFTTECSGNTEIIESEQKEVSIYPNPTNSILNIETEYPYHFSIEITSLNGQLIFRENMEGTTHQLDLSTFQKGVYFITIRSEDFVATRKIIKL